MQTQHFLHLLHVTGPSAARGGYNPFCSLEEIHLQEVLSSHYQQLNIENIESSGFNL